MINPAALRHSIICLPLLLAAQLAPLSTNAGELRPRGIVKAVRQASYVTDIGEPVVRIGARAGESFNTGDLLVAFDCRRLHADISAAKARHRELELTLQSNVYLDQRQAVSRHEVAISQARVEQTAAEVASLSARSSRCEIRAPYQGRVAELSIFEHETPVPGRAFLAIVGDNEFEIMLVVPSAWLAWLKPGVEFAFLVEETGSRVAAVVDRLGGQVDAVSQTLAVYARLANGGPGLIAGMSGTAMFSGPASLP